MVPDRSYEPHGSGERWNVLEGIELSDGNPMALKMLHNLYTTLRLEVAMQTLFQDLRYALRQMGKTPGLALLAILTLALGVGANAAIFTVIESVLLRPLPYPHSDRLVYIAPKQDNPGFGSTSWLNYRDIRAHFVGEAERIRHHSNHGARLAANFHRLANNLRIGVEAIPPQAF